MAHIPVRAGLPRIGHLIGMGLRPLTFLTRMQREHDHLVHVKVGGGSFTLITNPHLVEQVLVNQHKLFQKDRFLKVHAHAVFGNGLLASDGDFWLRQRRMAQPAFHRTRIATYADIMTKHGAAELEAVRAGTWFDFHEMSIRLALHIAAETLFSHHRLSDMTAITSAVAEALQYFSGDSALDILGQVIQVNFDPHRQSRYLAAVTVLDTVISSLIHERRTAAVPSTDLLQMLIDARDEDDKPMSDQQLLDECKTMFLAGHETSALSLSWTMWLLATHPHLQARARAEVQHVLGQRRPSVDDIQHMPFLDTVIKESMRLYPPAWVIQRETICDVTLNHGTESYLLSQGLDVLLSPAAMHRDPRWYRNPDRFDPDRWSDGSLLDLPKYAYFPFGGGPRLCIGQAFAQLEVALLLVQCLQRGQWHVHPLQRVVAQASITQRPKYGLTMRYEREAMHDRAQPR